MAESPASVKTAQPLKSNDLKVRPAAEQICEINRKKGQIVTQSRQDKIFYVESFPVLQHNLQSPCWYQP